MKKRGYISIGLVLFLVVSYAVWYFLTKKENVCHIDSTTGVRTTISLRWFERTRHLAHGDFEGDCSSIFTYVPDDGFEKVLISRGYDDVVDNYVLTSNINSIENLLIPEILGGLPGIPPDERGIVFNLIGIEDFTSLTSLTIGLNRISTLDLSKNVNLIDLEVRNNPFTEIDLTMNTALEELSLVGGVTAISLDLSKNPSLTSVTIALTEIRNLNLKNENNRLITQLDLVNNSTLTCVQVDDIDYSNVNWSFFNSPLAFFSEDCGL